MDEILGHCLRVATAPMRRLIWSPQAIADLDGIRDYIRDRNPKAARRIVATLIDAADRLMAFPNLGKPGPKPGLRTLVVPRTRFLIDYRTTGECVEIVAVTHAARHR